MIKHISLFAVLLGMVIPFGCSKSVLSEKVVSRHAGEEPAAGSAEEYSKVRSKWTIVLGPKGQAGPPMFSTVLSGGQEAMPEADFPLTIEATLMDDQVIEAGLAYYKSMVGMTPEEGDDFRQAYWVRNEMDQSFLIEASLQTTWAENYLDLSRWIIFVEGDEGNQYEPVRIVEQAVSSHQMEETMPVPHHRRQIPLDWTQHRKDLFLYFPRQNHYGRPVLHKGIKKLKLVFLLEKEDWTRAEGSWIFQVEDER